VVCLDQTSRLRKVCLILLSPFCFAEERAPIVCSIEELRLFSILRATTKVEEPQRKTSLIVQQAADGAKVDPACYDAFYINVER
jgi:hypothetical protein